MINAVSNTFFISAYLHLYYMKYTSRIQPKPGKSLLCIASDSNQNRTIGLKIGYGLKIGLGINGYFF
jgi:hypothetical protein